MRRRRVLAASAAAVGLAGCSDVSVPTSTTAGTDGTSTTTEHWTGTPASAANTTLGGNLNARPGRLRAYPDLIAASDATWMHAFLDVREKYEAGADPSSDPDVAALRWIKRDQGAKLFLNLKWNFTGIYTNMQATDLPRAGSDRERALIEYGASLLDAIGEPVDRLVLGNEPVWETPTAQLTGGDRSLIDFTERVKQYLLEHETAGGPTLLVGAFNRLYDEVWTRYRDFYEQLFDMARSDDAIDGVDLHVHYYSLDQLAKMLDVARNYAPDGLMTVSEFSPVFRYADNVHRPIGSYQTGRQFAEQYGVAPDTTTTQYLQAAKADPLPPDEIAAFYDAMPWYNVHLVEDIAARFAARDVDLGTIGFLAGQEVRHTDWTKGHWSPFQLNCVFQPGLIDSPDGGHPYFLPAFRRLA